MNHLPDFYENLVDVEYTYSCIDRCVIFERAFKDSGPHPDTFVKLP
jgi:hypothetical protein